MEHCYCNNFHQTAILMELNYIRVFEWYFERLNKDIYFQQIISLMKFKPLGTTVYLRLFVWTTKLLDIRRM